MSETFLTTVTAEARQRVALARANGYLAKLIKVAEQRLTDRHSNRFLAAVSSKERVNIIAEIKRSSPSKGVIKANVDVERTAKLYNSGGAAAISVLTEPKHFDGSISDLISVSKCVDVPVLRKDFIVDEYQIVEAAAAGASAILLIIAALEIGKLRELHSVAGRFGLDVLTEVHDAEELAIAADIGAKIIGVNNRNLHSLEVSLDTSRELIKHFPKDVVFVAESGISTRAEIEELRSLGYDGFLIGETLMRSGDPAAVLEEFGA